MIVIKDSRQFIESIGWIGSLLLSLCAIPELVRAVITGNSPLTWTFLLLWFSGEVVTLIYTIFKSIKIKLWPLLFNYGINIICLIIIILYKGTYHG